MPDLNAPLLFVDDEPAFRALMVERLSENGFEVSEADCGEKHFNYLNRLLLT